MIATLPTLITATWGEYNMWMCHLNFGPHWNFGPGPRTKIFDESSPEHVLFFWQIVCFCRSLVAGCQSVYAPTHSLDPLSTVLGHSAVFSLCLLAIMICSARSISRETKLSGKHVSGTKFSRENDPRDPICPRLVSFQAMRSHASTGAIGTKTLTSLVLYKGHWTAVPLFPLPVRLKGPWRRGKRLRSGSWRPPRRRALSHPGPSRGELISSLEGWQGKWAHAFGCDLE